MLYYYYFKYPGKKKCFLNINTTFKSGELIFRQKKKRNTETIVFFPFFFKPDLFCGNTLLISSLKCQNKNVHVHYTDRLESSPIVSSTITLNYNCRHAVVQLILLHLIIVPTSV